MWGLLGLSPPPGQIPEYAPDYWCNYSCLECGYLIVERNVIILTWGKGNPIHLEQENIQVCTIPYYVQNLQDM